MRTYFAKMEININSFHKGLKVEPASHSFIFGNQALKVSVFQRFALK